MTAFEEVEPEGPDSAAQSQFSEQSKTISADVQQANQTFPSQCHSEPPVICFAITRPLSRNDSVEIGSATVSVALAGVPPASRAPVGESLFDGLWRAADVFGQRPKTASGTLALPEINCMDTA
jgi:hypothetical protein